MPNLSVLATILLVVGTPLPTLAQTSTRANPAASPETSTAPGKLNDQEIKTKLETLGYSGVRDILSTPKGINCRGNKRRPADNGCHGFRRQGHPRDANRPLRLRIHMAALATRALSRKKG